MDFKRISSILDARPSWYYAIKGHVEKNGGDFYEFNDRYEVSYPDDVMKDDFIQYARNLGKEFKETEDRLVIYK